MSTGQSEIRALKKCIEQKDEALEKIINTPASHQEGQVMRLLAMSAKDATPSPLSERAKLEREIVNELLGEPKNYNMEWTSLPFEAASLLKRLAALRKGEE
jgi:hypothetical protein